MNVKDIIKILLNLLDKNLDFGILNIYSGKPIKIIDLVKYWKKKLNSKIILNKAKLSITDYETYIYYGDCKKLKRILNEKI